MIGPQLPFVIGVLGNFSGVPAASLPKLKDRRFVGVTRESFGRFLAHMSARLTPAAHSDAASGGVLKLELTFERIEDFLPENISKRLQSANAIESDHAQR
jgi:type VI secretion system protein ImpB